MKFVIAAVVSVLTTANLFAANPVPPKGHECDSCLRVPDVLAAEGKPCKVVFEKHDWSSPCEIVGYYDRDGKIFMEARRHKERRTDGRGNNIYRPYKNATFVGENGRFLWCRTENFDYYGKKTHEQETNNCELDKEKHFDYRLFSIDRVYCGEADFDRCGNWVGGVQTNPLKSDAVIRLSRKIYYYGDNAAVEREVAEKKAYADSIATKCKESLPSATEKSFYAFRHKRGFFKNVLLPLLLGFLTAFVPSRIMRPRRKISNLMIVVINLALLIVIWYPIADILYGLGPYDHIFAVLYWFLLLISYLTGLRWPLRGRCPRCASLACSIIDERVKVTTETETGEFADGHKEVLSRHTSREYHLRMQCEECGHTWWTML